MGEGLDLSEDLQNTPIRALGPGTRRLLSWYLDPPAAVLTSDELSPDIVGLADLAGFDAVFIRYLETQIHKTETFLDAWGTRNNATIGHLEDYLKKLERFDCINDVKESLIRDVNKWSERSKTEQKQEFHRVTTKCTPDSSRCENYIEDALLTVDDVTSGSLQKYTACICCSENDLDLANLIVDQYSNEQNNFRFFIPQKHLLGGSYEFEATAEVIESRCDGRLIVILSESYLSSPACSFATQFAKTLDPDSKRRKIIPIVKDENIIYPRVLRGITTIKAHRLKHGDAFWRLLTSSLLIVPRYPSHQCANNEPSQTSVDSVSISTSSSVSSKSKETLSQYKRFEILAKNITEEEDTSNISRDSVSLRSSSFDSASDLGECEDILNGNELRKNYNTDTKNRYDVLKRKSDCKSKLETVNMRPIYKTQSVPNVLELNDNGKKPIECTEEEIVQCKSSSWSLLCSADSGKKEMTKKDNKSPRKWLLTKLLKSFKFSCKHEKNRGVSKEMSHNQLGKDSYIQYSNQPSTVSPFDVSKSSENRNTSVNVGNGNHGRAVTVPLEQKSNRTYTSSSSDVFSSNKRTDRPLMYEQPTSTIVSQRRVFVMNL